MQYANKLLISRAVDANGTFDLSGNTVSAINEDGKVEIDSAPIKIQVGSKVNFSSTAEDEYTVVEIEDPVEAVRQIDNLTIDSVAEDTVFTLENRGEEVSVTADADDTPSTIATQLGALIEDIDTNATNVSVEDAVITISASVAGVEMHNEVKSGTMTLETVQDNVPGENYELVFEDVNGEPLDFNTITSVGADVYIKDSAINALATAPIEGNPTKTAAQLKIEAMYVANDEDYSIKEMSIEMLDNDKLKFIAKSSGSLMNGVEVAVARESDFASGVQTAFKGISLNSYFETKPSEANKEIAILVKEGDNITSYVVSMKPDSKDYRGKSNYIEDILNKYDSLVYVKDNTMISDLPVSCLYNTEVYDVNGNLVTPMTDKLLRLSNGSDGTVNRGDIDNAYGFVEDGTIFGNKEELDIDIVIANEDSRLSAARIASDRKDCIAFLGARFEDTVGLKSTIIVDNMISDVNTGELNSSYSNNSFSAFFGNYKMQYDKFNDKMRFISLAGDAAGLRANTNENQDSWWASAGLERGQVKLCEKLVFNPNQGMRDFLVFKNYNS